MKLPHRKTGWSKEIPKAQLSAAELRDVIEEYANELREIMKRLRRLLN
jgi:hypothetical protein